MSGDKPGRQYGWVWLLILLFAIAVVIGVTIGLVATAVVAWLLGFI